MLFCWSIRSRLLTASQHLHKFAALLAKISFEEQFYIRVEFEESCVEELGGGLSDRGRPA